MGLNGRTIKTEHNGAKNGGGYYGTRQEAKTISSKVRRVRGRKIIDEAIREELEHES